MPSPAPPPLADPAFWRGKRVVVTGGAGFVGSHLVERLLPFCASITVPTRRDGVPENLAGVAKDVKLVRGDLRDPGVADTALRAADVVFTLAATVGGIEYNRRHHASLFRDNISVFITTLEAARRAPVGRVLVVSSACVYPRDAVIPTPESEGFRDRPEPTNAGYGWSKRMEEYLASACAEEYGLSIAVARPYNAYGPRDDFDPATSHVIPALIRKAFDLRSDTLEVWGSGRQSRSFLYVTDFADGLIRICERARDAEPTNVGADEETTIGEIAQAIVDHAGTGKKIRFDPSRPEGQARRHCDTTRLQSLFDFRARMPLADGLSATVEWFRTKLLPRTRYED